jgi:hypothetical protein
MLRKPLALGALLALMFCSASVAQTASDIAATCRTVKNTESSGEGNDYPGMSNTAWRCMNGSVYVCEMGASGRGCMKTGHSTAPHKGILTWCRENPNSDFVPGAYMAGSPANWRCRGTRPVIIESEGVDERGYMKQFWRKVGR